MPIQILHQDITTLACDVIVNPTDEHFTGLGGVDGAVHRAAGSRLRKACGRLAPLSAGEVCCTKGYGLKSKYVIHTVGPRWQGGEHSEAALLRSCYTKALALCEQLGVNSVAFPLISSGTFGFPKNQVLRIALDAVSDHLFTVQSDLDVTLCVLNRDAYSLKEEDALKAFLAEREPWEQCLLPTPGVPLAPTAANGRFDDACEEEETACADLADSELWYDRSPEWDEATEVLPPPGPTVSRSVGSGTCPAKTKARAQPQRNYAAAMPPMDAKPQESLDEWLKKQDDSFAVTLLKLIDKKGMTDVDCYKRSNVSRKTFSKINTRKNYKPSKQTVLAFAVGLQLTLEETETLLRSAGFSLSRSYTADKIVEYFIRSGNYDIFEINAALYQYDQVLLGC